jgi:hypothetical protein
MKPCIINYAQGCWYPAGQARLRESVSTVGGGYPVLTFTNAAELGCPPHGDVPYAFKPYAFKKAMELGYDLILWCDASVWAIKPLKPVFDYLEQHSHLFFQNSNVGRFSSDACLEGFGLSRDDALTMPELTGCCLGINATAPVTQEFFRQYFAKANDGFSFIGAWTNERRQVSSDPRCFGHRHDQTCASIIANRLGMQFLVPHETYFSYWAPVVKDSVVLLAQGM